MGRRDDRRRLRNYLVNKEVQLKIVCINLVYMLIITIVTLIVLLSPILHDMLLSDDLDVQYRAAQSFLILMRRLAPAVVVMLVLNSLHQLFLTHRICGPLVNFAHTFKKISEGDLTRKVFLRKKDYLRAECERINEMVDSLATFIANVKGTNEKLISVIEEGVAQIEDEETKTKMAKTLGTMEEKARLVEKGLSIFELTDKKDS